MMRSMDRQTSFFDVDQLLPEAFFAPLQHTVYGIVAEWGDHLLTSEDFAGLYHPRLGRPAVSPVLLAKALLLQFYEGVSDREAEHRAAYDLRWKYALHLPLDQPGIDHVTLCRFRARLVSQGQGRKIFNKVLALAVEAGLLSADAVRVIDSTCIFGAGAVHDTYTLIRKAIRKVAQVTQPQALWQALSEQLHRQDYTAPDDRKPEIDWSDASARLALLQELVADARRILEALADKELPAEAREAVELLAEVTEQDIEEGPDGSVRIRHGVAKDRILSITDPEMRHGRKTNHRRFDGYKAHVAEDPGSELITSVAVTPGNVPDAAPVLPMLEEEQAQGRQVHTLIGDTAYGSATLRAELHQRGISILAPTVPVQNPHGLLPKTSFVLNLERGTCRCPAGYEAVPIEWRRNGSVHIFRVDGGLCRRCPLQPACTQNPAKGRRIRVHPHEALLQQARALEQTEAFREAYRNRSRVERKLAELVRHGLRQARYYGTVKVTFQLQMIATVVNLKRIWKLFQEKIRFPSRASVPYLAATP